MPAMRRALLSVLLGSTVTIFACGGGDPPKDPSKVEPKSATGGPAPSAVSVPADIKAIVDAPDRDGEDKALDAGRRPGEMLAFYGIKPGMKVADLAAGGGYTTELLARAVGPSGVVYAQNNQWIMEKFADKPFAARLAKPVNKNVVKAVRDFNDPLPPEAKDLDAVFFVLVYHDAYWFEGVDRAKMNAAILKALKPGGVYAIIDHNGKAGSGTKEVQTLHRIEQKVLVEDVTKAGFKLAGEADFLRNPKDTMDWNAAPFAAGEKRGTSDRFVLKFVKP
jgi:predicted methyltransferase